MTEHDYSEFKAPPSPESLERLSQLAQRAAEAATEVTRCEEALKAAKKAHDQLVEQDIPELMDQLNVSEFALKNGLRITVKNTIHASIPKADSDSAHNWLEEHGHGGLIKRQVIVAFSREQEEQAKQLAQTLASQFENTKTERWVESATLRAFVSDQMKNGVDVPRNLFGIFEKRVASLKFPK